jgi:hypothetical protein
MSMSMKTLGFHLGARDRLAAHGYRELSEGLPPDLQRMDGDRKLEEISGFGVSCRHLIRILGTEWGARLHPPRSLAAPGAQRRRAGSAW